MQFLNCLENYWFDFLFELIWGFELRMSCIQSRLYGLLLVLWLRGLGNYFVCKRFAVETLLWSIEFVIQINLEHDTIAFGNLARGWRPWTYILYLQLGRFSLSLVSCWERLFNWHKRFLRFVSILLEWFKLIFEFTFLPQNGKVS